MPHFVIDCSRNILQHTTAEELLQAVYATAEDSGLFAKGDIKVRINAFEHFLLGEGKDSFLHVFANIMQGRTEAQKSSLSHQITARLKALLPAVPIISINVVDFDKASYCNRSMVE